ncbi:hypothetical protein V8B97DRAFT_2026106 [Scleroderma yunnanense]
MSNEHPPPPSSPNNQHPRYWFDDGSIILRISDSEVSFKLHGSLLSRHSTYFRQMLQAGSTSTIVTIPPELGVQVDDFVSLLEHLYHDTVLSPDDVSFPHTASLLRISSPPQLDIPLIHRLARAHLERMYPSGPVPFVHPGHLDEALALAVQYKITSIQKGLYYSLVTTTDFEPGVFPGSEDGIRPGLSTCEDAMAGSVSAEGVQTEMTCPVALTLTPADVERCRSLMTDLVDHFTPILFTPPTTPHMPCTDVFADQWMPLVVQSAITNSVDGGIYKPLETLERIKQIDWAKEGLCPACVWEKRDEWTREQEEVWEKMDGWLSLNMK